MKKLLLPLILGLIALLPMLLSAQSNERMLVYSKSGEVLPYRVEYIDSVKFLSNEQDLALNPTVVKHPNGATGAMKLTIGSVGADVKRIKVILPETYMIDGMTDAQCLRLFSEGMAERMRLTVFDVEADKEYDLTGMQQGYKYSAVFLTYDEIGCPGKIKRVDFQVPEGSLKGNPQIEVTFSDITQTGYKATLKPNADVKAYYFLNDETDSTSRDELMKMMRVPDLHHYIVRFGSSNVMTGEPHQGEKVSDMNNFKPGTKYSIFVVLVDQDGQLSKVQEFTVTTAKKGTSQTATVKVEVKDITETSATVVNTPDENTSVYRETIVEKALYNEEEIIKYLKETPDNQSLPYHSDAFTWTWPELKSATAYYAVAIAQNADGKWGPLTKVEFTTKR